MADEKPEDELEKTKAYRCVFSKISSMHSPGAHRHTSSLSILTSKKLSAKLGPRHAEVNAGLFRATGRGSSRIVVFAKLQEKGEMISLLFNAEMYELRVLR